jgi:hypothetical protein
VAIRELRRLGLPARQSGGVMFTVCESPGLKSSLVDAYFSEVCGGRVSICQVVLLVKSSSQVQVVREVRFHETDEDTPEGTTWALVDLVDVNGDGRPEIVLEGDSYEDHWLEVVQIVGGSMKTVFSGLGYYL